MKTTEQVKDEKLEAIQRAYDNARAQGSEFHIPLTEELESALAMPTEADVRYFQQNGLKRRILADGSIEFWDRQMWEPVVPGMFDNLIADPRWTEYFPDAEEKPDVFVFDDRPENEKLKAWYDKLREERAAKPYLPLPDTRTTLERYRDATAVPPGDTFRCKAGIESSIPTERQKMAGRVFPGIKVEQCFDMRKARVDEAFKVADLILGRKDGE